MKFSKTKIITLSFFLILFPIILWKIYYYNVDPSYDWILGDWLVNYHDGGFKRRGLSGSMLFILQDVTGIKLQYLAFFIQVLLYFLFLLFFVLILWKKKISIYFFSLMVSPLTFLFYFGNTMAFGDNSGLIIVGKKEILLFTIFSAFIYLLSKKKLSKISERIILLFLAIATLIHELIFFFNIYFILALYIYNGKIEIKRYVMYFMSSFIPILALLIFGGDINQGNSVRILLERGVVINEGILYWPKDYDAISFYQEKARDYFLYLITLLIGIIHFTFFLTNTSLEKKKIISFLYLFAVAIIYTIPLFILAIDWGRWLHIHFMLTLMILLALLPNEKSSGRNLFSLNYNIKFFDFLFLFLFCFTWKMEHFMNGFIIGGLLYEVLNFILK